MKKLVKELKIEFKGVFEITEKLLLYGGIKAEIKVKVNSIPILHRAYSVLMYCELK